MSKNIPWDRAAALSIAFATAVGTTAHAGEMTIPVDLYNAAIVAGSWIIQGEVMGPNGGRWVYCVDIGPASGWIGAGPADPQTQMIVPAGVGGWAWDNGASFPCVQIARTVQAAAQPQAPPTRSSTGGQGGSAVGDPFFGDLNRTGR